MPAKARSSLAPPHAPFDAVIFSCQGVRFLLESPPVCPGQPRGRVSWRLSGGTMPDTTKMTLSDIHQEVSRRSKQVDDLKYRLEKLGSELQCRHR
jgi:hypothetical protein